MTPTHAHAPRPVHWKALLATLAAAVSLAGGVQAFAAASANAQPMQEGAGQCADWLRDYFPTECAEMEQGSGGDGGFGSGEVEGGTPDDNPDPGGGEVIVVEDTKPDPFDCIHPGSIFCESPPEKCVKEPGTLCLDGPIEDYTVPETTPDYRNPPKSPEKEKDDRADRECQKLRQMYELKGKQYHCPVFCPETKTYANPITGCHKPGSLDRWGPPPKSLKEYMKRLDTCAAIDSQLNQLDRHEEWLRDQGNFDPQVWKSQGYRGDRDALTAQFGRENCHLYIRRF